MLLAAVLPTGGDAAALLAVPAVLAWAVGRFAPAPRTAVATLTGGTALAVVLALLGLLPGAPSALSVLLTVSITAGVPWWAGRALAVRREQAARARELVEQQARWVERQRIAQDVHDALGHDLALIALQAGAWELAADATPAQRDAAGAVRAGATAATDRLHTVVGLLAGTGAEPDLAELVDRSRERGVPVDLVRAGPGGAPWSEPTRHAAYRIVQECLTNAARHAPAAPVTVTVHDTDPLRIEVVNPAAGPARSSGGGRGLAGLRARAARLGGTLEAGSGPDGFRVVAVLPRRGTVPADPGPGAALRAVRRRGRRLHALAALVPVALAVVAAAGLATAHVVTVERTALSPQRYDTLQLDRPRSALADRLPARSQAAAPPVLAVPPAPAGTRCELYPARASVFDLGPDMFRLCFSGGADPVLVAKDRLVRAGAP